MADKDIEILSLLATGVSLLAYPAPAKLPDSLELGLQYLQALSWERTLSPLFADWLWWDKFEYPIGDWWPGGIEHLPVSTAGAGEGLLHFGAPTSLCKEWAIQKRRSLQDQLAEIEERIMYEILTDCRAADLQEMYVNSRRFLIENPIVREVDLVKTVASGRVHSLVGKAYEPLPSGCIKDGQVHLCPHCGDAQIWRGDGLACRNWTICQTLAKRRAKRLPATGLLRSKAGIFTYVVAPGLPELRLYERLQKLGCEVQLWPGVDAFDLLVALPKGQRWAVDVKLSREGYCLGRYEREKGFIPCPEGLQWDRAFYVIPHFFDASYPELFCRGADITPGQLSSWNIQVLSDSGFVRKIKRCAT
jgi:hypothetical protein